MTLFEAITLGVVQGLTEFLPISSTAHLRIVPALLGWDDPGAAFSAVIQCGTLVAVVVAMRRDILDLAAGLLRGLRSGRPLADRDGRLALMIVVGTLPIVLVGFTARHLIRGDARRLDVIAATVLAATLPMALAEFAIAWRARRSLASGREGLAAVGWADAVPMGLAQVLALVPGTSRSGVTISSGMLTGLDRRTAARFSFLLSLPAIGAAGVLEAWQQRHAILGTGANAAATILATVAAGLVGYASIRWLLMRLTSHTLWPFVAYRVLLAGILGWLVASEERVPAEAVPSPVATAPAPVASR